MYSMNAHSAHPKEAWELLKYLRNEEADMEWLRRDMGATATTRHALESDEAKRMSDLPVFVHELEHARPWPPHPKMMAVASDIFTPYIQKAIVGELTPQEAMDAAAKEAQELIEGKR